MKAPRLYTIAVVAALVAAFLLYAFWPRAIPVDIAEVVREPMMTTIDEEAKARVHDSFIVATPAAGRLLRVEVEPGDPVEEGESIVARMLPANPSALDIRTEEQAEAAVSAAEAALELARAEALRASADFDLASSNRERFAKLFEEDAGSQADLDHAERDLQAARAALRSSRASIAMREADLRSAQAMLMSMTGEGQETGNPHPPHSYPIIAPSTGVVLQVFHESETTLPAGAAVLEIGDPETDLEICAELLSAQAVRVRAGDRVIIERWGGDDPLEGVVSTVEPWAFTKISALGIEEQRVNVVIDLVGDKETWSGLGHGYRAYVKIVTWEDPETLTVPASTLFRNGDGWTVFIIENGRARMMPVEVGRRNAQQAELRTPIPAGTEVVLYPSDALRDGARIKRRG